ncbi:MULTISPECIES: WD40 repeat domain-containing protein [Saccharothrix]|uniref:WD40 repeat domain-containing protein n=1 Tax=Saccharothrix TaxID=2071 RepID=UPI00093C5192|nr:hypothetical protein [Saccharothrix sp. CB00851]
MRILWTTSRGTDPRLARVLPAVRGDAVARAVVDGVPVHVTATEPHYDGDCARPHTHDCAAATLRVWDAATGELLRTVHDTGGQHLATAVVGGRPVAVTCGWGDAPRTVDLASGVVLGELTRHRDVVRGLATVTLPDGPAAVSAGWDGTIRVVDLATGRARVLDTGERLDALAVLDVGGRPVAAVAGDVVDLWDLDRGVPVGYLPTAAKVREIAGWPGAVATLSWDGDVELWDVASAQRLACGMPGRRWAHDIAAVAAEDGRRLIALSDSEAVHLWDVEDDRPVGPPLVGPTSGCALADGGPGVLVTVSDVDESIGVWRIGTDARPLGAGHQSTVRCLAVTADRVIAGGTDGTVGSWRLADGGHERVVGVLPAPVRAVAAVGDRVLAGGGDLNGVTDRELHRWRGDGVDRPVAVDHRGEVRLVVTTVLDDRPVALTAGCDETLHVTDVLTGDRIGGVPGGSQPDGLAVGELDGRPVVAISRAFGPFGLWDLAGNAPITTPITEAAEVLEQVRAFVHTGDGPAVVTVRHHVVRVRALATGDARHLDPDHGEPVTALAVHPGRTAAVARADCSVTVFDLDTLAPVDALTLPHPATALAWTPDGDLVVACRRDLLRLAMQPVSDLHKPSRHVDNP